MRQRRSETDWNVMTDPWMEMVGVDAEPFRCSPVDALHRASQIRCITSASPIDSFAAHRFLLTLLYWKADKAGGVSKVRQALMRGRTPRNLFDAIKKEADKFRLFDNKKPFLQDTSANKASTKSAGSLFAEFACGTNIAHFHHGDDDEMRLCLPCATIGMLRIIPWTQSGGAGLSPAVHNAPPIVAMAIGENLAATLGLNLVELEVKAGKARWSGCFKPSGGDKAIPYLEAFTWNPRRVHLRTVGPSGVCWRCGHEGPVVGPIVYAKNENTKLNKKSRKTIPFTWQDPSAFYNSDSPYVTIKSYDESRAANGRDLDRLIDHNGSQPTSIVLQENLAHENWQIVVPCTNPANNKTYDHRHLQAANLSSDTIRSLLPPPPSPWRQREVDGWREERTGRSTDGSVALVRSAVRLFTHADWAVLASAAHRPMHESPAAFDLLCGLHWPLRRKVSGLPSRNVAWLVLKLMAAVPSRSRVVRVRNGFCPLDSLPKRQIDECHGDRGVRSAYPVSLPCGQRLEAALHDAIHDHLRRKQSLPIDWAGLCYRLNGLLD